VATKDPNAAAGIALGGAPLVLAPLAALAAGRSVLTGTAARRAKIQKEIEEFEKAKAKKAIQADVDGDALFGAAVRHVIVFAFWHAVFCRSGSPFHLLIICDRPTWEVPPQRWR
jgi:hypothetical protein